MDLSAIKLPGGVKLPESAVCPMSNSDDLYLMIHSTQKKAYGLKGKIGMRGGVQPPAEAMKNLVIAKKEMIEAKKRENEVQPLVDPKHKKDPTMSFALSKDQLFYVHNNAKAAGEEMRRKAKGEKRTQASKDEVLRMILQKFNQQQYWTLKSMGIETQQPEVLLSLLIM